MRRRAALILAVAVLTVTGCQSSRAQRGDFPREGGMASPLPTPAAGQVHDHRRYTWHDPL